MKQAISSNIQKPAMARDNSQKQKNIAIIGAGLGGVTMAAQLMLRDLDVASKYVPYSDINVSLYEKMSAGHFFSRAHHKNSVHYDSSSIFGYRSVSSYAASNEQEFAENIASAELYKKIHHLAIKYGIYEKLAAEGYPDLQMQGGYVHGQDAIIIIDSADQEASNKLDISKENIKAQFVKWQQQQLPRNLSSNNLSLPVLEKPYIDAHPPRDINDPDALSRYRSKLRDFIAKYPRQKQSLTENFPAINRLIATEDEISSADLLQDQFMQAAMQGEIKLPRVFIELGWDKNHPERNALSINSNGYIQTTIRLLQELYPEKFNFIDGVVANPTEIAKSHDAVVMAAGANMMSLLASNNQRSNIVAAPYLEIAVDYDINQEILPLLKKLAIPQGRFSIQLADGSNLDLSIKTITRNGVHFRDGKPVGELLKIQFSEKMPLSNLDEIYNLPAANQQMINVVGKYIANYYGYKSNVENEQDMPKFRWCPQTIKNKDLEVNNHNRSNNLPGNIYIIGPGDAHGAKKYGGTAAELTADICDKVINKNDSSYLKIMQNILNSNGSPLLNSGYSK